MADIAIAGDRMRANGYTFSRHHCPDGSVYWHGPHCALHPTPDGWGVWVQGKNLNPHARLTLTEAAALATYAVRRRSKRFVVDDYSSDVIDLDLCDVDCAGRIASCYSRDQAEQIAEQFNRMDRAGIEARVCDDCESTHYGRCLCCEGVS